jgi:hypothetical protein
MQRAHHTVETWCDEVGPSVNPDKTDPVIFTKKRKLDCFFEPLIFGVTLRRSESVRYLGVTTDFRLTWRQHVNNKVAKAQNSLRACRSFGTVWGLRPRVVYWLYTSIIRPSITFASLIWWTGCQTPSAKKQLSRVQRLACLGITGAMRTAPTGVMEALVFRRLI